MLPLADGSDDSWEPSAFLNLGVAYEPIRNVRFGINGYNLLGLAAPNSNCSPSAEFGLSESLS